MSLPIIIVGQVVFHHDRERVQKAIIADRISQDDSRHWIAWSDKAEYRTAEVSINDLYEKEWDALNAAISHIERSQEILQDRIAALCTPPASTEDESIRDTRNERMKRDQKRERTLTQPQITA